MQARHGARSGRGCWSRSHANRPNSGGNTQAVFCDSGEGEVNYWREYVESTQGDVGQALEAARVVICVLTNFNSRVVKILMEKGKKQP